MIFIIFTNPYLFIDICLSRGIGGVGLGWVRPVPALRLIKIIKKWQKKTKVLGPRERPPTG